MALSREIFAGDPAPRNIFDRSSMFSAAARPKLEQPEGHVSSRSERGVSYVFAIPVLRF